MFRLARLIPAALVGGAAVLAAPSTASAQVFGSFGRPGFVPTPFGPVNPVFHNRYAYQASVFYTSNSGIVSTTYSARVNYQWAYSGVGIAPRIAYPIYPYASSAYSGSMGGGYSTAYGKDHDQVEKAQKRAAAAATMGGDTRRMVYDQWAADRMGLMGANDPRLKDVPDSVRHALVPDGEEAIVSGDALNHLLVAAAALQPKASGKEQAAYLQPELLAVVRFAGHPAAEAVNLFRVGNGLTYPPALTDDMRLGAAREVLDGAFAAVSERVRNGKPVDVDLAARLTEAATVLRDRATPILRDLPFEEATSVRRFLNQLDLAAAVARDPHSTGVVSPTWAAAGTTVAELVKHMSQHKLLFGPAKKGDEAAYVSLHRGLANYYTALAPATNVVKK